MECQHIDRADIVILKNIDADDAFKNVFRSAEEFQERFALCSLASRCHRPFVQDNHIDGDGDGDGDKDKDAGDDIIVSDSNW